MPDVSDSTQDAGRLFRDAVGHHHAGRLDAAERGYRAALARDPSHIWSLHHLGIIALQTGRSRDAVALIGRVVDLNPSLPEPQYNLGLALQGEGRFDDAAARYRAAIALSPDHAAACPDDAAMTNLAQRDSYERGHPDVVAAMYHFAVQKA
jgi:tetratricopeptide (TPR) repeat protein